MIDGIQQRLGLRTMCNKKQWGINRKEVLISHCKIFR